MIEQSVCQAPGQLRASLLKFIMEWVISSSASGRANVFWLHGLAGAGKSTLATTIANQLQELGLLGAFLFFTRDAVGRSDPSLVIKTLAYQVSRIHDEVGRAVANVLMGSPGVLLLDRGTVAFDCGTAIQVLKSSPLYMATVAGWRYWHSHPVGRGLRLGQPTFQFEFGMQRRVAKLFLAYKFLLCILHHSPSPMTELG